MVGFRQAVVGGTEGGPAPTGLSTTTAAAVTTGVMPR